jgi:hypothetical protein
MTDPIRSSGPAPEHNVIELEPITISASPGSGAPAVPMPIGEIAADCLSKLAGVAAAGVTASAMPLVGALVGLKAGLELGECAREVTDRVEQEAAIRHALEQCAAEGGTPLGLLPGELTCGIPVEP